jgi:hypothetical protein
MMNIFAVIWNCCWAGAIEFLILSTQPTCTTPPQSLVKEFKNQNKKRWKWGALISTSVDSQEFDEEEYAVLKEHGMDFLVLWMETYLEIYSQVHPEKKPKMKLWFPHQRPWAADLSRLFQVQPRSFIRPGPLEKRCRYADRTRGLSAPGLWGCTLWPSTLTKSRCAADPHGLIHSADVWAIWTRIPRLVLRRKEHGWSIQASCGQ